MNFIVTKRRELDKFKLKAEKHQTKVHKGMKILDRKLAAIAAYLMIALIVAFWLVEAASKTRDAPRHFTKASYKLPKLFDFEYFKSVFHRHYTSFVENLLRQKLFLARSFCAFLSAIDYKHGKATSYLAVNQFSDWTNKEIEKLFQKGPARVVEKKSFHKSEKIIREDPEDASETKALEEKLAKLPVDRISDSFKPVSESAKTFEQSDKVASNNPNYEPVELMSQSGSTRENTKEQDQISPEDSNVINRMFTTVANLATGLLEAILGPNKEEPVEQSVKEPEKKADFIWIDHRESGCFFEPRNQQNCASCYLMGVISLYEWFYCKETGKKVAFSEQYPLDCGRGRVEQMNGCGGGLFSEVATFTMIYGLELRDHYPYFAREDQCPYELSTDPYTMGYIRVDDKELILIKMEEIPKEIMFAPILINFGAIPEQIISYGGGIDEAEGCDSKLWHTMLLVGMGTENGLDYLVARNSWSAQWGELGHYRFSTGAAGRCTHPYMVYILSNGTQVSENSRYMGEELLKKWKLEADSRVGVESKNPTNITGPVSPF